MDPVHRAADEIAGRYFTDANWPQRLARGDALILGRALTLLESCLVNCSFLLEQSGLNPDSPSRGIGITGPPGVGKSTLIGALIRHIRSLGETVAVIAFDPTSPFSGGALLGDRLRMGPSGDKGVFIRSMAARNHLGGTALCASGIIQLLASLFDNIIVETVGTGQSETEIHRLVKTCVVVCVPGLGDEIQMDKAGVLEIGNILVVNQADRDGARETVRQLRQIAQGRPVLSTVATTGEGVKELFESCVDAHSRIVGSRYSATSATSALEAELARAVIQHFRSARPMLWENAVNSISEGKLASQAASRLLEKVTTLES